MKGALRYEWLRIRTIRSTYWLSGLAIVLSACVAGILSAAVNSANNSGDLGELSGSAIFTTWIITAGASGPVMPVLAAAFFAVLGAMTLGHEYRYGTNKATLLALPDRPTVLTAKAVVLTGWVVASAVLILLIDAAIAAVFVPSSNFDAGALRSMAFYLLYCVGFALAGFGLAAVWRSQVAAIVSVLVWPLVIEPVMAGVLQVAIARTNPGLAKLANFLPASAGRRTMFRPYQLFANLDANNATIWGLSPSAVVYAVGLVIVVLAGSWLFVLRDA